MKQKIYAAALLFGAIVSYDAHPQTATVPPPLSDKANRTLDQVREGVDGLSIGTKIPSTLMDGLRWSTEAARNAGGTLKDAMGATREGVEMTRQASGVFGGVVKTLDGVGYSIDLYRGCSQGGAACTEAEIKVLNELSRDALINGMGHAVPGPARPAYYGSVVVGNAFRSIPIETDARGRMRTMGDAIDDMTWSNLAEPIYNKATTGYWDPMSDQAMDEQIAKRRQELRSRMQSMSKANEQAATDQLNAQLANSASSIDPGQSQSTSVPFNSFLFPPPGSLPNTSQLPTAKPASAISAPAPGGRCTPARTLDPKTGCHSGHSEQSHPGGCKCEPGSTPH